MVCIYFLIVFLIGHSFHVRIKFLSTLELTEIPSHKSETSEHIVAIEGIQLSKLFSRENLIFPGLLKTTLWIFTILGITLLIFPFIIILISVNISFFP